MEGLVIGHSSGALVDGFFSIPAQVRFVETKLSGVFLIDLERREDYRGFFARTYCRREMIEHGLSGDVAQCNLAYTHSKGTVRGLHYQLPPAAENKLVRCIHGAVFDVMVDLRAGSTTYLQHLGIELTADDRRQIYVPEGICHGYQSLTDDAELLYFVSAFHSPESERGLRFNDPSLGIEWPTPVTLVSPKDMGWPLLDPSGTRSGTE